MQKWVNLTSGSPIPADFTSTGGLGTPICINGQTAMAYFMGQGSVIQQLQFAITPQAFGAKADGVTNDNLAVVSALTVLAATALTGHGYGSGTGPLYIPKGNSFYNMGTSPIDLTFTTRIAGDGFGNAGGWATALKWGINSHGFRIQYYNTSGDTATGSGVAGGTGSVIEKMALQGSYTTTEGEYHGIFLRSRANLRDLNIWTFQGDGIHIHAGVGLPESGNANNWEVRTAYIESVRCGMSVDGGDTNQGISYGVQVSGARQWGFYDNSGNQNLYVAPLTQLCGWSNNDGTVGKPVSAVHYGGQRYAVVVGQEVWASTHAPSGLSGIGTGDNTGWYWYATGGADAFNVTWFNGIATRAGGPYYMVGATLLHPYAESDQLPNQFGGAVLRIGGTLGNRSIGGAHIFASANQVCGNDFRAYAGGLSIDDNVTGIIKIGYYSSGNTQAIIECSAAASALALYSPSLSNSIVINDVQTDFTQNVNLASGKVLKVGAIQVITTRQTGWTAATGTPARGAFAAAAAGTASAAYVQAEANAALTRIAALEARLIALEADIRTHGLIN